MNTVVSRDGTRIALDRSGDGPPVILVGGALSDRAAAGPLAALLAGEFTAVAYDRRGRGDSDDAPAYAVEREVEDIAALVEYAGGAAFVFGHSSGAVLALEAAARGVPMRGLAMYEPPFLVDDSRAPIPDDYIEQVERLVASGRRGEAVAYFMTVAVAVPPAIVEQMRAGPAWASLERHAHTIAYDGRVMGDTMRGSVAPLRRFAAVGVPTLALGGGASPEWLRRPAELIAGILPNARYQTLEGQNHGFDPAVMAPVLAQFFGSLAE